ncbi:MAG TPA: hypothetical protein PLV72_01570 [Candidatus Magasanikbacteria bacterium]|nr:hypothetical protein [Candidatus Magasanikbacteria bacterium]
MLDCGKRFIEEGQRKWARVAFISHALLPGYRSTDLITARLVELGRTWSKSGEDPGFIRWFSFPVVPPESDKLARPVWVDFYIIPVLAPAYLAACKSDLAYSWAEAVALHAVEEAQADGVALTIGWGAMTKVATGHGKVFFDRHPELANEISTTHGDAGTTSLVMSAIKSAGLRSGFRVSVIGANGAIGEAVSRALVALNPSSILLVGKPDKEGETKNRDRLDRLAGSVRLLSPVDGPVEVLIHQDKSKAVYEHQSDLVIVATTGMDLAPNEIPKGTLVMDMTTPSACQYHPDWSDERLVLTTGCGQMHHSIIPNLFGFSGVDVLSDVGAGGEHVLWGCTGETIVRAVYEWKGHVVGQDIPMAAVDWCTLHFARLGFYSEPPVTFGRELVWHYVRQFVKYAASNRGMEQKSPAVR